MIIVLLLINYQKVGMNGLPKSIRFSIEDGLIISAKEFWKL